MPIPTPSPTESVMSQIPDTYASPARVGDEIGQSLQGLSNALTMLNRKRTQEDVPNLVAQADYTKRYLDRQTTAPKDASGFYKDTSVDYDNYVNDYTANIQDNATRKAVKDKLLQDKSRYMASAARFEVETGHDQSRADANDALIAVQNKVRNAPDFYDNALRDGMAVIDARTLPAGVKDEMKTTLRHNLARSRFEAMAAAASTPEAIDGIANELAQDKWKAELAPADYDRVADGLKTMRSAIQTKANTDAKAAISSIADRNKNAVLIDPAEMSAVEQQVKLSSEQGTLWDFAEIKAGQDVLRQEQTLPPKELAARRNASQGDAGAFYPNLPARVNDAVNAGSELTGGKISTSYLAGTAVMEYQKYLNRSRPSTDAKFAPQPAHKGVDMRNVSPVVQDAASVAGEIFGAPLVIMSGHRTAAKQKRLGGVSGSRHIGGMALDISTVGMDERTRARLVDSLTQAGFTGFGEYETHIHADMRGSVPASYGERDGKVWGGWTYLSPEVAATLSKRGVSAGVQSTAINRLDASGKQRAVTSDDGIDYGRGSDLGGNALGLFQFMPDTWLEMVKPNAEALGIQEIGKLDDSFLLAMRADPVLSAKVGALYAMRNKNTLEMTLGREVSDPELHMAHVFGPAGAVALFRAMQSNPNVAAADILPKAAAANRQLFYANGKTLSASEVYGNITANFMSAPSRVAHVRNEMRQKIIDTQQREIKNDMVSYGARTGRFQVGDLSTPEGIAGREKVVRSMADYYDVPEADAKPLTNEEAASYSERLKGGTAEEAIQIMTELQGLGSMARNAFAQLGEKEPGFEHAAGLAAEGGQDVAVDIIRGQRQLRDNPDIRKSLGATEQDINDDFYQFVGRSLMRADPRFQKAIQDDALAYYIQRNMVGGKGQLGTFDQDAYKEAVNKVLGSQSIGEVNGEPTVLPAGVNEDEFDDALDRMTTEDYVKNSVDGSPPRYIDGTFVRPEDIAIEGKFRAVGNGEYQIELADATFAVSDITPGGRFRAYRMRLDAKAVEKIASRPLEAPPQTRKQDRAPDPYQELQQQPPADPYQQLFQQ